MSRKQRSRADLGDAALRLEASYSRTLAIRSSRLSPLFTPLSGFSATQLRADVRRERYDPQVNPFRHTLTVTSVVVDSEMEVDNKKKRLIFTPGDFSLIPRGTLTNGFCHTPAEFVHLQIEQSCLEEVCVEVDANPCTVALEPTLQGRDELLKHLSHVLVGELSKGQSADVLYAEILARALVAHIAKRHGAHLIRDSKAGELGSSRIAALQEYISVNLGTTLHLEQLAKVANISPSKLHRCFKSATGETLHRYVTRQRVNRAKALLITSKLSLPEIAAAVGLADQSHLTRILKQHTGLTPRAFRTNSLL